MTRQLTQVERDLTGQAQVVAEELQGLCPSGKHLVPFLALVMMLGLRELQHGDPMDQETATKWLHNLWDTADMAFIQPSIKEQKPKAPTPMAGASYIALEGYFSGYGDFTKMILHVEEMLGKMGFQPKGTLDVAKKLARVIKTAQVHAKATGTRAMFLDGWMQESRHE
jgi:hypothetical protein